MSPIAGYPARLPRRTVAAAAALALVTGGCVSPAFRQSVGQFGTLTKAAAADQSQRLGTIVANEQERIRAERAAGHVDLRLDPACAEAVTADPATPAARCGLVRADGQPLEEPLAVDHVLALGTALTGYADSLIALAADPGQDRQTFATSVSGLGSALGKLDGAVRQVADAPAGHDQGRIGAVATVIGEAGGLYFAYRRAHVLKRIVTEADPIVQQAVDLLAGVQGRIGLYDRARLFARVQAAQARATQLAHNGASAADLRTAQNQLYDQLATFNRYGADIASFRAIGEAHHKLALAARRGASPAELAAAIEAIIHLAGTIHTSVQTLENPGGSR